MKHRSRLIAVSIGILLLGGLLVAFYPRPTAAAKGKALSSKKAPVAPAAPQEKEKVPQGAIGASSYYNDISPPLRDMPAIPITAKPEREANENPRIPHNHADAPDTAV